MLDRTSQSIGRLAAAGGAIALGLGSMWLAGQGSITADTVEAANKSLGTLYQGARSLPILLAWWVGALGLGWLLRVKIIPDARHRIITQMVLGVGGLLLIDWLLAALGWLNGWTAWASCGIGTAVVTYHFADPATRDRWHPDAWPAPPRAILLCIPALGILLVACSMPPGVMWAVEAFGYDVTSYHLQVPREWLAAGQMVSLKHNVYSHLPLLAEAGYMKLAVMHGSVFDALYTIHFLHASIAVLAATALGRLVADRAGPVAGFVAAAVLLATPWTIITGSMAYSEMFVQLFGIGAIVLLFDPAGRSPRGAFVIGLFLGLAMMAKLTAAGFIVFPVFAAFLWRLTFLPLREERWAGQDPQQTNRPPLHEGTNLARPLPEKEGSKTSSASLRENLLAIAMLFAGLVLMLTPYLVRNALWTGNPVFPFAAATLGPGHWNEEQVTRWNNAHHAGSFADGLAALPRQWLLNAGYGAIGGSRRTETQATDIARFDTEYGLPLFWIAAFAGLALLLRQREDRPVAAILLIILSLQLLFWLLFTHHQSRFLIPTLLPGCIAVGLGLGRLDVLSRHKRPWLVPLLSITLVGCMTMSCYATLWSQTPRGLDPQTKQRFAYPPYLLIDSLIDPRDVTANQPGRFAGQHPLNQLPATNRTLLVGEAANILYIQRAFLYNTAFDQSLFARLLREHKGDPLAVTVTLVRAGFTHVWINTAELARLNDSYGVESELAPDSMRRFLEAIESKKLWRRLPDVGSVPIDPHIRLYALPAIRATPTPATPVSPVDAKAGETKNP